MIHAKSEYVTGPSMTDAENIRLHGSGDFRYTNTTGRHFEENLNLSLSTSCISLWHVSIPQWMFATAHTEVGQANI